MLRTMPTPKVRTYAAIDLGSNSCRLLVAQSSSAGLKKVESYSRTVRLSAGFHKYNYISHDAAQRALAMLNHAARRLQNYFEPKLRCVATEACRQAMNTKGFFREIYTQTGFEFSVISEQEEARLTALGITELLDYTTPYALVFDVGGGSTEIIFLKIDQPMTATIIDWLSLPVGVVSIVESMNIENVVNYINLTKTIKDKLTDFGTPYGIAELIEQNQVQLIGCSGTATTTGAIHLNLRFYDRDKIDGLIMTFDHIQQVIRQLQMMSLQDRSHHPCIGPDRADLILGGMAIFEGLAAAWPVGKLRVADRGVRNGIVKELYEQDLLNESL